MSNLRGRNYFDFLKCKHCRLESKIEVMVTGIKPSWGYESEDEFDSKYHHRSTSWVVEDSRRVSRADYCIMVKNYLGINVYSLKLKKLSSRICQYMLYDATLFSTSWPKQLFVILWPFFIYLWEEKLTFFPSLRAESFFFI